MSDDSANPNSVPTRPTFSSWWGIMAIVAGMCGTLYLWSWFSAPEPEPLPINVTRCQYELAREAFEVKRHRPADRNDALYWLAEQRLSQKQYVESIDCYAAIPTAHTEYGRLARYRQGVILIGLFRAVEGEKNLREFIELEEAKPKTRSDYLIHARQRLRHVLEVEGRLEERHQVLRGVIERGEDTTYEPIVGCFPSLVKWIGPDSLLWIEHFHESNPDDPQLNIALGRYRTAHGRVSDAKQILEKVVQEHPSNRSAIAALIACLREADEAEELARVFQTLPPRSPDDPWQLLLQRGADAIQNGEAAEAVANYEQLIQQDRTCAEAWQGLGQAARFLDDAALRKKALDMASALGRIQNQLGKTFAEASDPNSFLDVADRCAELALNREGAIMTRCAVRLSPKNERVQAAVKLFRERLIEDHEPALLGN